jgi:methionyl aminopeptidase
MIQSLPIESPSSAPELGRNDPCWCGSGKKYKKCHLRADQQGDGGRRATGGRAMRAAKVARIKTPEQIEGIRRAGRLTRRILDSLVDRIVPGVTTRQIDDWVTTATRGAGAKAAPLGYKGFPRSCCTSVNEVVCHGIPGNRTLTSGDIVNVDVTSILAGYFGDANQMYAVGEVSEEAERLMRVTRECLELGIEQVRPGGRLGDIGHAIQTHAEAHGYSVVRQFGGHGVGLAFHEEPHVSHYGKRGTGPRLEPGMVFTIEPMINAGHWEVEILADGWTAVTQDGSLSAQYEHTVAVTSDGVDVLTV